MSGEWLRKNVPHQDPRVSACEVRSTDCRLSKIRELESSSWRALKTPAFNSKIDGIVLRDVEMILHAE